ncbi:hypothetical protein [Stenotrophomonas sp. Iso1]|uniref:hypothetical protein n=1 Tax=Stenotrophomonas sp. Iso1 TaxID=2977283 RepID=UPI0022B7B43C|nr:hypothetical protein [Stenotrophomonas sp. Iso1]
MDVAPQSPQRSHRLGLMSLLMPLVSLVVGFIAVSVIHGGLEKLAAGLIITIGGGVIGTCLGIASRWRKESREWMGYVGTLINGLMALVLFL